MSPNKAHWPHAKHAQTSSLHTTKVLLLSAKLLQTELEILYTISVTILYARGSWPWADCLLRSRCGGAALPLAVAFAFAFALPTVFASFFFSRSFPACFKALLAFCLGVALAAAMAVCNKLRATPCSVCAGPGKLAFHNNKPNAMISCQHFHTACERRQTQSLHLPTNACKAAQAGGKPILSEATSTDQVLSRFQAKQGL